jgi:two-component sensor histidine kinase
MELKLELESVPGASAEARERLRGLSKTVSGRTLADLLFVVTELVTNSVKFGPGEPIELMLDIHEDGSVVGLVGDGGVGTVAISGQRASTAGGLGLRIVDQLTSNWGVGPRRTDVWFELPSHAGSLQASHGLSAG